MNQTAKADEVRQTVQRLIQSGSAFDVEALDRIYHKDLRIIKVDERDELAVINRKQNMDFFRAKRESGAEPLSREAVHLRRRRRPHRARGGRAPDEIDGPVGEVRLQHPSGLGRGALAGDRRDRLRAAGLSSRASERTVNPLPSPERKQAAHENRIRRIRQHGA